MSKKNSKKSAGVISRLKGLTSITDTFNRTNGGLGYGGGTSSVPWTSVRGSWAISSNKASTSNTPSDYSLSTLVFTKEDVTLQADGISPGVGTAFWVTDSNNWWGTYVDATQTCQTCYNASNVASYVTNSTYVPASGGNCASNSTTCSAYNTGNPTGTYGQYYAFVYYDFSPPSPSSCSYYDSTWTQAPAATCGSQPGFSSCCRVRYPNYNPGNCSAYVTNCTSYNTYTPAYTYNTANISTYNASTAYSCNCTTGYSVKVIKNISGTITQVASFAYDTLVQSLKTILSGSTITVRGYSDIAYATQIGADQSTSSTGASKTKKHGILHAPVTYSPTQTSVIDGFIVS